MSDVVGSRADSVAAHSLIYLPFCVAFVRVPSSLGNSSVLLNV